MIKQKEKIKRILQLIIGLIALISISAIGVIIYQKITAPIKNGVEAIPTDAEMIINIKNPSKSWSDDLFPSDIWKGISSFSEFNQLTSQIKWVDSLVRSDAMVSKMISDQSLYISLHPIKENRYAVLFSMAISKEFKSKASQFLASISASHQLTKTEDEGIPIYKNSSADGFSFYSHQGVFACSNNLDLLRKSAVQIQRDSSILSNKEFKLAMATEGTKTGISIYINYNQLFSNIAIAFKPEIQECVKSIDYLKGWSNTELLLRKDLILMSGYVATDTKSYLEYLKDAPPVDANFAKELDGRTFFFSAISLLNFEHYISKYAEFKQLNAISTKNTNGADPSMLEATKVLFKKLAPSQVIASATTISDSIAYFLTIKPKDIIEGQQILIDEISNRSGAENKIDTTRFHDHIIGKIDLGTGGQLFGNTLFSKIDIHYFSIGRDYIHFAKSKKELEATIESVENDNSLAKSYIYQSFDNDINSKGTMLVFLSPFEGIKMLESNIDTSTIFGRLIYELAKKTPYIGAKIGGFQKPYTSVSVCWKYLLNATNTERSSQIEIPKTTKKKNKKELKGTKKKENKGKSTKSKSSPTKSKKIKSKKNPKK